VDLFLKRLAEGSQSLWSPLSALLGMSRLLWTLCLHFQNLLECLLFLQGFFGLHLTFYFIFILLFIHLLTCVYRWISSVQNLFCSLVLLFCYRENIGDTKTAFLLVWDKDSYTERFLALLPCMHLCIATHIGSSLPDLFTTFWSPSHSGLCQLKITLFAPQQGARQPHSSFRFPFLSLFLLSTFSP
jgi:hypothetical protein